MENEALFTILAALMGIIIFVIIVTTILLYKDFIRFLKIKGKYKTDFEPEDIRPERKVGFHLRDDL